MFVCLSETVKEIKCDTCIKDGIALKVYQRAPHQNGKHPRSKESKSIGIDVFIYLGLL